MAMNFRTVGAIHYWAAVSTLYSTGTSPATLNVLVLPNQQNFGIRRDVSLRVLDAAGDVHHRTQLPLPYART